MADDRILELLAEWEEGRQTGRSLTPQSLCPDDLHLQTELQRRIGKRLQLERDFDLPASTIGIAGPTIVENEEWPSIDGYEILDVLGQGGTGTVFRAFDRRLQREVALKVLHPAHSATRSRDRLSLEAAAVARLQHPHIVQIFEIGECRDRMYLTLELVSGGSLAGQLHDLPWSPRRAAEFVRTVTLAVAHAHDQGIVHRDLKPGNILLTADGTPKVADFGLAKRLDDDLSHTQTGTIVGTPSYMAPEQAAGRVHDIGPATDVHALGALLYQLLVGQVPFQAATLLETLEQVRLHDPVPLHERQPTTPRDLETICQKCLEKQPENRYSTARALAEDLQRFLEGSPIAARSSTLLDHVVRSVHHVAIDPAMSQLSPTPVWLSPIPILVHTLTFLLCRHWPSYPFIAIGVTMLTISALLAILFVGQAHLFQRVRSDQRRHLGSVWFSHAIAFFLSPAILWASGLAKTSTDWLLLYPLWLTNVGTVLFAIASNAGPLYLLGSLCFATALLSALTPLWAPLEVGALISFNMLTQGLVLRSAGREEATNALD